MNYNYDVILNFAYFGLFLVVAFYAALLFLGCRHYSNRNPRS